MRLPTLAAFERARRYFVWITQARSGSAAVILTFMWRVLLIGLNLVNGILVVRNLGPAGRGEQTILMLWPLILPSIVEFGIPYSLIFFARSRPHERRAFYGSALFLTAFCSILAYGIGYVGMPIWLHRYGAETVNTARMLLGFTPFSAFLFLVLAITDSEHAFPLSNALRNIPTVLTTLLLLIVVLTHKASPLTTSLSYYIPTAIVLCTIGAIALRRYQPKLVNVLQSTKLMMSYGIKVYGSTLIGTFGQQIDQLLVIGLLNRVDLGIYGVALSASRVLNVFPNSLLNILLPKIVGRSANEIANIVGRVSRISMLCTAAAGAILSILVPFLIPKLFGNGLVPGIVVSQLLILELVFASTAWVLMQSYLALDRPATVTILQGISLSLCIPFMLIFIPRFGLIGAALALLLSTVIRYTITLVGYAFILNLPIPAVIPSKEDLGYLLAARKLKTD